MTEFYAILGLFMFPEAEPSISVVVARAIFGFALGLWALPNGINRIRVAKAEKEAEQHG